MFGGEGKGCEMLNIEEKSGCRTRGGDGVSAEIFGDIYEVINDLFLIEHYFFHYYKCYI